MTSRNSTERLGDFSESVVFHLVSGVSSWVSCLFRLWLSCVLLFGFCFVLKTPRFLLSPILQHAGIANLIKPDWWPSELRARTAWAKKKRHLTGCLPATQRSCLEKLCHQLEPAHSAANIHRHDICVRQRPFPDLVHHVVVFCLCRCSTWTSNLVRGVVPGMPSWENIQSVYQAAWSKPLGTLPVFGVWRFPCRYCNLNQVSTTTSSFRCCTWSVAEGTVCLLFPVSGSFVTQVSTEAQWCRPDTQPGSMSSAWLSYLSLMCIRDTVGSQDLKAVALKEPVHLFAKPTKRNHQSRQWPIAWQVN